MSTLVYLNGRGEAVTVAVGNPPKDDESGQPIYPPVESPVDARNLKCFPSDMIVPAQPICNGIVIGETMQVGDGRKLVPAETNLRAPLREALAEYDALLQLQVLPRLTVEGVKTEQVLQVLGKLQAAKCPFGLMAFQSSGDDVTHISMAAMGPLLFGDFMGALGHFLNANQGQVLNTEVNIHYVLALSTHQTRTGDYGMEGEEWIACLFGSKDLRTPFAALQGSGAAWSTGAYHTHHYLDPNGVYDSLRKEVVRLGKILGDVLGNDGNDEVKEEEAPVDSQSETSLKKDE